MRNCIRLLNNSKPPFFRSGESMESVTQRSVRFQLPVPADDYIQLPDPDDSLDCLSELRVIGSMITEMEKSVQRFQTAARISSLSHPICSPQKASVATSRFLPGPTSNLHNDEIAQLPRTSAKTPFKDFGDNGLASDFAGFDLSPQMNQKHLKTTMPSAISPSIGIVDSTVQHELSEISPAALTRVWKMSERTHSISKLFEQDNVIENRRLFHSPAPAPSSPYLQPLKSLNTSKQNSNCSIVESSVTGELASRVGESLGPSDAVRMLSDSATTLKKKLQAMDAKNREIDTTLAQFLQRQTPSSIGITKRNKMSRPMGLFEQHSASFNSEIGATSFVQQ
jgi:hypothetical protein